MTATAHFSDIKNAIIKELNKACFSIDIAVPWFTDFDLFKTLISRTKEGISVRLIILNDEINKSSNLNYLELTEINNKCKVWLIDGEFRKAESIMHNKFCIIDNNVVVNGSFNWTVKANINQESITIHRDDPDISKAFHSQFNELISIYFGIHNINYLDYKKLWLIINNLKNSVIASDFINADKLITDLNIFKKSLPKPVDEEIDKIIKSGNKQSYVNILLSIYRINNIISNKAMSLYYSASKEYEKRNFDTALSILEESLEIKPDLEVSLQLVADIFNAQQHEDFAISYYGIAKATNPHSLIALRNENNYGIKLTISEKTIPMIEKNSHEIYQEYIYNNPNSFQAHIEYGSILIGEHKFKEAENILIKAMELDAYNIYPLRLLGEICMELKRFEEAVDLLLKYTAIENKDYKGYLQLSFSLYMLEKHEEATIYLENIHSQEPKNIAALCILADCYLRLDNLVKTKEILSEIFELDIKNEFAINLKKELKTQNIN